MLWCESCDATDIRSGDWSCDRLGNKGGEGHVIWKRDRWAEKKKCTLECNIFPRGHSHDLGKVGTRSAEADEERERMSYSCVQFH